MIWSGSTKCPEEGVRAATGESGFNSDEVETGLSSMSLPAATKVHWPVGPPVRRQRTSSKA